MQSDDDWPDWGDDYETIPLVRNTDASDIAAMYGGGAIRDAMARATAPLAANQAGLDHLAPGLFDWPDLTKLPPLQWVLGKWMLKGELTVIVAPGGVGKSTVTVGMAASIASGRDLLAQRVWRGAQNVWLFNLEDDLDWLHKQVGAATAYHGVTQANCAGKIYVNSGVLKPMCVATEDANGVTIAEPVYDALLAHMRDREIASLIIDPFVSCHAIEENSNTKIDQVVKRWKRLAQEAGASVTLVHHSKKTGGREATAEDSRGASAVMNAARIGLVLNGMTQGEADMFGVTNDIERRQTVRIDNAKANRAPPSAASWVRLKGFWLDNDDDVMPSDSIAVATSWTPPDAFEGVTVESIREIQARIGQGEFAKDAQAKDWAGHVIGEVVGFDVSTATGKARAKRLLTGWIESRPPRFIVEKMHCTRTGRDRPMVIVGEPIEDET